MGGPPPKFFILLWQHWADFSARRSRLVMTAALPLASYALLYAALFLLPIYLLPDLTIPGCNFTKVRPATANSFPEAFRAAHTLQDAVWRHRAFFEEHTDRLLHPRPNELRSRRPSWGPRGLGGSACQRAGLNGRLAAPTSGLVRFLLEGVSDQIPERREAKACRPVFHRAANGSVAAFVRTHVPSPDGAQTLVHVCEDFTRTKPWWKDRNDSTLQMNGRTIVSSDYARKVLESPNFRTSDSFDRYRGCICDEPVFFKLELCKWINGHVLFFPNDKEGYVNLMKTLEKRLLRLSDFAVATSAEYSHKVHQRDAWARSNVTWEDSRFERSGALSLNSLAAWAGLLVKCQREGRVRGFPNKALADQAAKEIMDEDARKVAEDKGGERGNPEPKIRRETRLWALVELQGDPDQHIHYRLTYHQPTYENDYTGFDRSAGIQVLLEEAAIEMATGKEPEFALYTAPLPEACRRIISPKIYNALLTFLLPFLSIFSFLLTPSNFLEQTLVEKSLKMREYLYIQGVGRTTLKLSWLLFFFSVLSVLSVGYGYLVFRQLPLVFQHTSLGVPLAVLLAYNAAHLMMCQAISSFLAKPHRTGLLIGFLGIFCWVLTSFTFQTGKVPEARLLLARLTCVHPAVPLTLALIYMCAWEEAWVGASVELLWRTPHVDDSFGGIGECLGWLAGDAFAYFLLSWYLEHLFPGDFGAKQPFWFPLKPRFWFPKRQDDYNPDIKGLDTDEVHIEAVPQGLKAGISLSHLTKHYNRAKVGVHDLSLNFYQEEVTAFLGQNGAGKSTTMNTLVGLIEASKGDASVMGMDIRNNMGGIRKILGFVPQYDILYPGMVVRDHLRFFGWLKGMSSEEIERVTSPLLDRMGLTYNKLTPCLSLSGGQQRKLSMITAYLGDPKVVILDEPTSGVDPFSRRHIWDLILAKKATTTTVLSTHFMDEADILGDRVAVISQGQLRASGTPMFLKSRYTEGFQLAVSTSQPDALAAFVAAGVPTSRLATSVGQDLAFTVPHDFGQSPAMADFLRSLEARGPALGLRSFGVTEPTMEEVFFASIKHPDQPPDKPTQTTDEKVDQPHEGLKHSTDYAYERVNVVSLFFKQLYVLSVKKVRGTLLSPAAVLMQVVLPVSFIVLLLLIGDPFAVPSPMPTSLDTPLPPNLFIAGPDSILDEDFVQVFPGLGSDPEALALGVGRCVNCEAGEADESKPPLSPGQCQSPNASLYASADIGQGARIFRLPSSEPPEPWVLVANSSDRFIVGGFRLDTNFLLFGAQAAQQQETQQSKWSPPRQWGSPTAAPQPARKLPTDMTEKDGVFGLLVEGELGLGLGDSLTGLDAWPSDSWRLLVEGSIRPWRVVVYHQSGMRSALTTAWHNVLLSRAGGPRLSGLLEARDLLPNSVSKGRHFIAAEAAIANRAGFSTFFITLCFFFATFGAAVFVQAEAAAGLKRLQMVGGVWSSVYWLTTLLWDLVIFALTTALVAVLLFQVNSVLSSVAGDLVLVMVVYGAMAIPAIYLLTFLFRKPTGLISFCLITFLFLYILGLAVVLMENFFAHCLRYQRFDLATKRLDVNFGDWWYKQDKLFDTMNAESRDEVFGEAYETCSSDYGPLLKIGTVLKTTPSVMLAKMTLVVAMDGSYRHLLSTLSEALGNDTDDFYYGKGQLDRKMPYSALSGGIWAWEGLGSDMALALVCGAVYFALVLFLEYYDKRISCFCCCRRRNETAPNPFRVIDTDVNAEKHRVLEGRAEADNLVLKALCKTYKGRATPAVDSVSVGVPPGECFGLLGINGAGKSTLFRMLTSFEPATAGAASLKGSDLLNKNKGWGRFWDASYCPQENTLFPTLTARQHLSMFAHIKGIPSSAARPMVECLIREVGLGGETERRAGQLSGGNQRKLQLALALLGRPAVVFLDEPSSGMDPGARRAAWDCVARATAAGSSVVLTSHSMEECEALCHRLVIMVAGGFQCLGSIQYLKGKFGNKYSFKLKLLSPDKLGDGAEDNSTKVKAFVARRHPKALLLEEHRTLLQYEVSSVGLALSTLFQTLSDARRQLGVEDFSLSQTTLEHIFVGMAKLQEKQRDGFVVDLSKEAQAYQVSAAAGLHSDQAGVGQVAVLGHQPSTPPEGQTMGEPGKKTSPPPAYSAPAPNAEVAECCASVTTPVEELLCAQERILAELSGTDAELTAEELRRLVVQTRLLRGFVEERARRQGLRLALSPDPRQTRIPQAQGPNDQARIRRKSLANFSPVRPDRGPRERSDSLPTS